MPWIAGLKKAVRSRSERKGTRFDREMTDAPLVSLSPRDYDAVLFDLDGVLTRTADVHAAAWKRLFDEFLERHAQRTGEPFVPFDVVDDYLQHVDGKPRREGVADFLPDVGMYPVIWRCLFCFGG